MTTTSVTDEAPRVWIGCLHCHNNGDLVGEWFPAIDADDVTLADLQRGRPSPDCEEMLSYRGHSPTFGPVCGAIRSGARVRVPRTTLSKETIAMRASTSLLPCAVRSLPQRSAGDGEVDGWLRNSKTRTGSRTDHKGDRDEHRMNTKTITRKMRNTKKRTATLAVLGSVAVPTLTGCSSGPAESAKPSTQATKATAKPSTQATKTAEPTQSSVGGFSVGEPFGDAAWEVEVEGSTRVSDRPDRVVVDTTTTNSRTIRAYTADGEEAWTHELAGDYPDLRSVTSATWIGASC